jgi:hypothetical protein
MEDLSTSAKLLNSAIKACNKLSKNMFLKQWNEICLQKPRVCGAGESASL